MYDKKITQEKKESLEIAESARESEWEYPSFVGGIFQGKLSWDLIFPYPSQSKEDKEKGDEFLNKLQDFLVKNLNPDEVDRTGEIPQEVIKGLNELGAFAVKIPTEYGGLGLSQVNYNRAIHLLSSYCGSTAVLLSAHQSIGVPQPLLVFGTEEQKKKFLPRFSKGAISGFALTEPDVGSDPRSLKTTATPTEDGKHYIINGEKLWCTNGNIADILVVMALTPPKIVNGKERKQITAFIVETDTPGFEVAYRCNFMGLHGAKLGLLKFKNVKVPRENILWGEGKGLKIAFTTLNTGRLTLPAAATGMSKWCLSVSRKWAKERKQWGSSIGEHEAIAVKLAHMAATVFAMDAITWMVSHMADKKKIDIRLESAMSKFFTTRESWKIINDTFQIRGGRGFETESSLKGRGETGYPVERMLRDSRINSIIEGSDEILHLFIAREALDPHLNKIKPLLSGKTSLFEKFMTLISLGVYYPVWLMKLYLSSLFVFKLSKFNLPEKLSKYTVFIARTAKHLAASIFFKMAIYQQR
ncbi:MAG: acyl-CoA dehydrogenase family protein, partial [Elusimicrobiota bacterium]|nr:acyl-CoA dehydrogenase family protein [Elusimicrobiota bacterium]